MRAGWCSGAARRAALAFLPARGVPVTTEIRCFGRHDHNVADAQAYLVIASRAQVLLARLVGLHPEDLEGPEILRHDSAEEGPGDQEDNHDDRANDHGVVGLAGAFTRSEGVETHA